MNDSKGLNQNGYDFYEVSPDLWVIHSKGEFVFADSFKKVIRKMIHDLNFASEEICMAIDQMASTGHNGAHFGVFKRFMFTFPKEFKSIERAS